MKNFLALIILSLLVYSTNCKKKVGKKKESEKYQSSVNICDEDNREGVLACSCTPSEPNTAKKAICWVYHSKIAVDDPIWEDYAFQSNLEKLKFNIRPEGTLLGIPSNALKYLTQLQTLEIQYGHLNELPPFAFANLSSITEISIPQNHITNLQPYAVANLKSLTILSLDNNKITEVKRDCIRDVPMLKMLFLNRNNLSIIHDYAFEHLHKLEDLELNGNLITIITRETFAGLKSLRYLDLRDNKLTMIGDSTFQDLTHLNELDLDQNNIEYVSEKAFAGLTKLTKLRLSDNQLKTLGNVFVEAKSILLLDLRKNGLEALTFETLEPLWENFKNVTSHIGLENNRFKCDCHLSWVHTLRNETQNKEIQLSLEGLTCISDEPESSSFTLATEKPKSYENINIKSVDEDNEYEYEDEQPTSDYENESENENENEILKPPRKKIFDIPIDKLPCPEMQRMTTEVPPVYWPEASSSDKNGGLSIHIDVGVVAVGLACVLLGR